MLLKMSIGAVIGGILGYLYYKKNWLSKWRLSYHIKTVIVLPYMEH